MHKSATKCNEIIGKWCKNKHGASKIIDTLETYHIQMSSVARRSQVLHTEEGRNLRSYIQLWSIIKNSVKDVSDERAVDAFSAGLCRLDLVEELGRTRPRTVSELMDVANRFADGEDAYNNKRASSPEVDRASRQRRRSHNEDSCTRRNQIAVGYERRGEEGYGTRELREKNSHEKEKPKYYGPSVEDMLHGPCHIHYAYLAGKRVSNHQMKDCRTFLMLQDALESNQGAHQGGTNASQGYQMQHLARHLESKGVHIRNDPAGPEVQKRAEEHIKASEPSNIVTTSYHRISKVVRPANQVQQSRPPKESTNARARANGVKSTNRRIQHWASIYGCRKWNKPDIRKDPKGNEHLAGMLEADRLLFPQNSTRKRKLPPRENRTRRLFRR
jgi:hypothetical protein